MLFFKRLFALLCLLTHTWVLWACEEVRPETPPSFYSHVYAQLCQNMPDFHGKMTPEQILYARAVEDQRPLFPRREVPPFLKNAPPECARSFVPKDPFWTGPDARTWYVVDHNINPGPNQRSYPLTHIKKLDAPYELAFGVVVKSPVPKTNPYFGYYYILFNNNDLGKMADLYFTLYPADGDLK